MITLNLETNKVRPSAGWVEQHVTLENLRRFSHYLERSIRWSLLAVTLYGVVRSFIG